MKTDRLRSIGNHANFCLSTPGTLPTEVYKLADEAADLIDNLQTQIDTLRSELSLFEKFQDQISDIKSSLALKKDI